MLGVLKRERNDDRMRRKDWTIAGLLVEAIAIVASLIYLGLQIYYGILYEAAPRKLIMNILVFLLVYAGLLLFQLFPEKVNRLSSMVCQGKIRQDTIWMVRLIKLIFILSLLFTSICDVMGLQIEAAYSLITAGLILITAIFYEARIIRNLRDNDKGNE